MAHPLELQAHRCRLSNRPQPYIPTTTPPCCPLPGSLPGWVANLTRSLYPGLYPPSLPITSLLQ
jgi:hypothetical protein